VGETQQAAETQFAEARVQRMHHLAEFGQHLCFVRVTATAVEQRLQRRPDPGIAIHQDLIAIDQQRSIISQPHGV